MGKDPGGIKIIRFCSVCDLEEGGEGCPQDWENPKRKNKWRKCKRNKAWNKSGLEPRAPMPWPIKEEDL